MTRKLVTLYLLLTLVGLVLLFGQGVIIKGNNTGPGVTLKGNVILVPAITGGVTLTSITVIPTTASRAVGLTLTYSAQGNFSDGSHADVTSVATWVVTPTITSNTGSIVTCLASGSSTVTATVGTISNSGTLTCTGIQVNPQGQLPNAINSIAYPPIQFTAVGGVAPYTFAGSGVPGWLSLTSGGLLTGTPSILGTYNFSVTATDSVSSVSPPDNLTVQVVNAGAEDNNNCQTNGTTNYSPSTDSFATLPPLCFYTAIANTAAGGSILEVCPIGQTSGGNPVTCPYHTMTDAVNFLGTQQNPCGTEVQIYATIDDTPTGTQNRYLEKLTSAPPISCGPPVGKPWIWIRNKQFASLPPAGTRISPAWAGQNSQVARPAYNQPATAGKYLPELICQPTANTCTVFATDSGSVGISGFRLMGLWITAPFGHTACHQSWGSGGCQGFSSNLVSIGCDNQGASPCGAKGAQYILLDRVLITGCEDLTTLSCVMSMEEGVRMQGGNYLGVIESYIGDIKCTQFQGPCVESHGIEGGNTQETTDDGPLKIVNNFIESSSVCIFMGGGPSTSGVFPKNIEIRRNHCWKPLIWKVNDPLFNTTYGGYIGNAWLGGQGNGYSASPTCSFGAPTMPNIPPGSAVQATCHLTVVAGRVTDIIIDNPGKGYDANSKCVITDSTGTGASCLDTSEFFNVKNQIETKHCVLCIIEGNVSEQVWAGQSDQDGYCMLLTPKNAGACPTCKVENVTVRYNFCRGSSRGMQVSITKATVCNVGPVCLAGPLDNISVHDNVLDDINGGKWISKSAAFSQEHGQVFQIANVAPQTTDVSHMDFAHITAIATLPSTRSALGASFVALNNNCHVNSPVLDNITFRDSIAFGGVRNTSLHGNGCFSCTNASCDTVQALNSLLTNTNELPVGGGFYTKGQLMSIQVLPELGSGYTSAPTCTLTPTSGGSACTAYKFGDAVPGGTTCAVGVSGQVGCYTFVAGSGYTTPPTVTLTGGGFTTAAFAVATLTKVGGSIASIDPETGGHGWTTNPTCSVSGGGGSGATCDTKLTSGSITVFPTANGSAFTSAPLITLTGGGGVGTLIQSAIGGIGNLAGGSWCFNNNGQVDNPFPGALTFTPYPTTQGDPTNNTCAVHTPSVSSNKRVSTWSDVLFKNFTFSSTGDGSEGPTGDLHLCAAAGGSCSGASPFHNAAGDGSDMGADIDKVLGTSSGTPSVFTGCFLNTTTNLVQCP